MVRRPVPSYPVSAKQMRAAARMADLVRAADEPAGDDPAGDDPAGDDPAGDDPAGDDPAGDDPAGDLSGMLCSDIR